MRRFATVRIVVWSAFSLFALFSVVVVIRAISRADGMITILLQIGFLVAAFLQAVSILQHAKVRRSDDR